MADASIYQLRFDGGEDPVVPDLTADLFQAGSPDEIENRDLLGLLDQLELALGDLRGAARRHAAASTYFDEDGDLHCRRRLTVV